MANRTALGAFAHCRQICRSVAGSEWWKWVAVQLRSKSDISIANSFQHAIQPVFALRAFNAEIARIRDAAQEPGALQMRFMFWTDFINGLRSKKPSEASLRHPVGIALQQVTKQHTLTISFLQQLIRAREAYHDNAPFQTLKDAETYGEHTCASLYYLTLECMGIRDHHADHVASHIGRAEGLVTLLRGLPYLASQGKIRLPLDVCAQHGVVQQDILRGNIKPNLQDTIHTIASEAVLHINTARSMVEETSKQARPCFLYTVCLNAYLDGLLKADFNVFDPTLNRPQGLLPIRLMWAKYRQSYP
eukprot:gene10435-2566_t